MEIKYPTTRQGMSNLSKAIKIKVLADGTTGECYAFTIAQEIDVTTDYDNTVLSVGAESLHFTNFRLGEKNNAAFHKVLDKINTVARAIAQELKRLNAPNFKDGNDWGFSFSDNGAVDFVTKIENQITLFGNVNTQYLTYAAGTAPIEPLLVKNGWVMADLVTELADAVTTKSTADQNHRDAKTNTQSANEYMATPEINIHKFGNFLQSRNEGRNIGDYGFDTSEAPVAEKPQLSDIPISGQKKLTHIAFDTVMTSLVNFDQIVHKGQSINSPAETLPAFGELAMTKGHSACIVVNPNTLKPGMVKVIVHK